MQECVFVNREWFTYAFNPIIVNLKNDPHVSEIYKNDFVKTILYNSIKLYFLLKQVSNNNCHNFYFCLFYELITFFAIVFVVMSKTALLKHLLYFRILLLKCLKSANVRFMRYSFN